MSFPPYPQEMPVEGVYSTVPPQGQFGVAPVVKPLSPLAITALVLGIISLLLFWVPALHNLILILALIATVVAILAVVQTRPDATHRGSSMAIASLVISTLTIAAVLGGQAMYSKANGEAAGTSSVSPQASKAGATSDVVQLENGKVTIEVKKVEESVDDREGQPTVAVTLKITNNDTSSLNPFAYYIEVSQNKAELDSAVYSDDLKPEGYEPFADLEEVPAGKSVTLVEGYVLRDATAPVTLMIDSTISSTKAFKKDYSLQ